MLMKVNSEEIPKNEIIVVLWNLRIHIKGSEEYEDYIKNREKIEREILQTKTRCESEITYEVADFESMITLSSKRIVRFCYIKEKDTRPQIHPTMDDGDNNISFAELKSLYQNIDRVERRISNAVLASKKNYKTLHGDGGKGNAVKENYTWNRNNLQRKNGRTGTLVYSLYGMHESRK